MNRDDAIDALIVSEMQRRGCCGARTVYKCTQCHAVYVHFARARGHVVKEHKQEIHDKMFGE